MIKNIQEFSNLEELLAALSKNGLTLDAIMVAREEGNLEPTNIVKNIFRVHIEKCPLNEIKEICLLFGEEDQNIELLEETEKAIRAREQKESTHGNIALAMKLMTLSLQPSINEACRANNMIKK